MSEQKPAPENSNHRALVGLVFMVLLVLGGLFLVHILRNASQVQDCVMSGRTNCAPIDSSARD